MKKLLMAGAVVLGAAFATPAVAEQPNCDWDCNWGFEGFSSLRDQAWLVEFQKEGGFKTNYNTTVNSTTNIQCDAAETAKGGGCSAFEEFDDKYNQETVTTGTYNNIDQSNDISVEGDGNTVSGSNQNDSTASNTGDVTGSSKQVLKDNSQTTTITNGGYPN